MNSGRYVFAQLLQYIDRYEFDKIVSKYNGDYRIREFDCWNQLIQLFFGQLTSRNFLREICVCLKAHRNKLYHIGIKQYVNQSTLLRAKSTSDCSLIEENYIDEGTVLRSDKLIKLNGYKSSWLYPEQLRLVEFYASEKDIVLTFLTNNTEVTAMEDANLYRTRWRIEVFFKWIKQLGLSKHPGAIPETP